MTERDIFDSDLAAFSPDFRYRVLNADGICIGTRRTEADAASLLRMNAKVLPARGPYRVVDASPGQP